MVAVRTDGENCVTFVTNVIGAVFFGDWSAFRGDVKKVAFVTGASRGIGKSCAEQLAKVGFDVAITARTVHDGEAREHSPTVTRSDMTPLPGSLDGTAELVRKAGREVMVLPADITDPASLGAAATAVLERWGRVDVVLRSRSGGAPRAECLGLLMCSRGPADPFFPGVNDGSANGILKR